MSKPETGNEAFFCQHSQNILYALRCREMTFMLGHPQKYNQNWNHIHRFQDAKAM